MCVGELSLGYPLVAYEERRGKGTRGIVPGGHGNHKICLNASGLSQPFIIFFYFLYSILSILISLQKSLITYQK